MSTSPLYLVGAQGFPNYGDELIAAAWLQYLAEVAPEREVWLDCHTPGIAATLLAGTHPRVHFTDTVWRLVDLSRRGETDIPRIIRHLGSPAFDVGVRLLQSAEQVHLLGGGYLNGIWPHHVALLQVLTELQEARATRIVASGLGLVPFGDDGAAPVVKLLSRFDEVTVRDEPSAAVGLPRGVDDAFLASVPPSPVSAPRLMVSLQSDLGSRESFAGAVEVARQVARDCGIPPEGRWYVEAIPGADFAGFAALEGVIPRDNFIPFSDAWQGKLTFDDHQLWVTSRFHHHLMAARAGACGVALISRPDYYTTKHHSLTAHGSNWLVCNPLKSASVDLSALDEPGEDFDQSGVKRAEAARLYR